MAIRKGPRSQANRRAHVKAAYRSGLEKVIAAQIVEALGPDQLKYERYKGAFTQPAKERTYTPDFILPNGIVIESKGLFTSEDRQKTVWVMNQWPDLDLRFVFTNPKAKLYKGSKTTYADWCINNGIPFAKKPIPNEWLTEPVNTASQRAILNAHLRAENRSKSKRKKK